MRKILELFTALILVASLAGATTITEEEVNVDLGTEEVRVEMEVEDLTSTNFTYLATHRIEKLEASSRNSDILCSAESSEIESQISCSTNRTDRFNVNFNYTSDGLVTPRDNYRRFEYTKDFIIPTENFSLMVTLPEGEVLLDQSNVTRPVYSPSDGEVRTNGQRISLLWEQNPPLGETTSYRALYRPLQNGEEQGIPALLFVTLLAVSAVLGGTILFVAHRRIMREDLEEVYPELKEDEKDVIELLKRNEGSMLQKDLVDDMEYSKAKISGIVSELVSKDIVVKEKEGRSNRLSISKEYTY